MKRIWTHIILFLLGIIAGMIGMYYMAGEKFKIIIQKQRVKNKRTSGVTTTTIPIDLDVAEKARIRASKEESKEEKKAKRQARRAKRKANK